MLIGLSSLLEVDIFPFLFEALTKPLFQIISVFEGIFKGLAGIVDPVSSDIGLVENAAGSKNVIVQLFQSKTMQSILTSLMLFGIVVLVLSVILAIIRNVYKDDSKVTISSIIGQAIKAVIGFILVPSLCLVGVMLSNVILVAVDGATNARGTPSFAAGIYSACQKEDPVQNVFNDVIYSAPVDYFGNINQSSSGDSSSGESTGSEESGSTTTDNTSVYDFHIAGIIYAQYLWQALTEDCIYGGQLVWIYRTDSLGQYLTDAKYVDVLGLKVEDDDLLDFTDMNNWDNGNGIAGVIDTKEDVALFYEMLKNQYTANFPNAKKLDIKALARNVIGKQYPKCKIALSSKTGTTTKNYFCAGSDKYDLKEQSFVYYYYGKALFDYNGDYGEVQQDEKYLKEAYVAFEKSKTFGATSWYFQKNSSQWTNDNLNKTLCLGDNINYFFAFVASIMVAKSLFVLCFGMAKRIVQLALYYVLSPIALALYPFDNGKAFGSWKSDFVGYTVGAFGAVAGVNLTIQLMPIVNRIQIFSSRIYNDVTQLILYIILAQGMEALVKTLSGWIGGKDLFAEGKATSQTAMAPVQKVAGAALKVGGAVVGGLVAGATAGRIASNNRKQANDNKTRFSKLTADQQQEEARANGFNSAADYAAALDKQISDNGAVSAFFKSAGGSALKGAGQILGSTGGGALGKQAIDSYKAYRGEQSTPSDSWLSRKLGGKGGVYRQVQEAADKQMKAALSSESQSAASKAFIKSIDVKEINIAENELAKVKERFDDMTNHLKQSLMDALDIKETEAMQIIESGDFSSLGSDATKKSLAAEALADFTQSDIYKSYQSVSANLERLKSSAILDAKGKVIDASATQSFVQNVYSNIDRDLFSGFMVSGSTSGMESLIKQAIESQATASGYKLDDAAIKQLIQTMMNETNNPVKKLNEDIKKLKDKENAKK